MTRRSTKNRIRTKCLLPSLRYNDQHFTACCVPEHVIDLREAVEADETEPAIGHGETIVVGSHVTALT